MGMAFHHKYLLANGWVNKYVGPDSFGFSCCILVHSREYSRSQDWVKENGCVWSSIKLVETTHVSLSIGYPCYLSCFLEVMFCMTQVHF